MEKNVITKLLIVAALAFVFIRRDILKSVIISGTDALQDKNVQAFLAMIRRYESAGKYNVIYGGQTFSDYSKHPNVRVPFTDPRTGKQNISTAAGAYQITYPTWQTVLNNAGQGDFSPASQDAAAVWLLKLNGSLIDIMDGDFRTAIEKASSVWASLPFTDSAQNHTSYQSALNTYTQAGGVLA